MPKFIDRMTTVVIALVWIVCLAYATFLMVAQ